MSKIVLIVLSVALFALSGCGSSVMAATGSVVDQNGHGLQDARVVFEGSTLYLVQFTDEAGAYKIEDLKVGSYQVSVSSQGCHDVQRSYEYMGGNVEMDLAMDCGA